MRICLHISYDGAPFHGWAVQPGTPTVQGCMQNALSMLLRESTQLTVAGRTDAGVHATGQVAHFDVNRQDLCSELENTLRQSPQVFLRRLNSAINIVLSGNQPEIPQLGITETAKYPQSAIGAISVTKIQIVPIEFDARFSALARHYLYRIVDDPSMRNPLHRHISWWYPTALDLTQMRKASARLLGEHDFAAFCKPRKGATTIRTLHSLELDRNPHGVFVRVKADAFCHSMVRSLVGALTEVGRGKHDIHWIETLLDTPKRAPEIPVAPAAGLTLIQVDYPQLIPEVLAKRQLQTRSLRVKC